MLASGSRSGAGPGRCRSSSGGGSSGEGRIEVSCVCQGEVEVGLEELDEMWNADKAISVVFTRGRGFRANDELREAGEERTRAIVGGVVASEGAES